MINQKIIIKIGPIHKYTLYTLLLIGLNISCGSNAKPPPCIPQIDSSEYYKIVKSEKGSVKTIDFYLNDSTKYIREFKNSYLIKEYFLFKGKKHGPLIVYSNNHIKSRTIFFYDEPMIIEHYYYDDKFKLDSVKAHIKEDQSKDKDTLFWLNAGKLIYDQNNKIDMNNSDYFTVNNRYPLTYTNSFDSIIINFYTSAPVTFVVFGILDSTFRLDEVMGEIEVSDTKYVHKFTSHESGFGFYSGIVRFCEPDKSDSTLLHCREIPFYLPIYTMDRKDLKKFPCE